MAAPVQYMAPAVQKTACQLSRVCSFPRMLVITCRHYIAIKSFFSTDTPIILDDLNQVILSITRRKKTVEKMMTLLRQWWTTKPGVQLFPCHHQRPCLRFRRASQKSLVPGRHGWMIFGENVWLNNIWLEHMVEQYLLRSYGWTIFVENIWLDNICWECMAEQCFLEKIWLDNICWENICWEHVVEQYLVRAYVWTIFENKWLDNICWEHMFDQYLLRTYG